MTKYLFFMIDNKYSSVMAYDESKTLSEHEAHIPKDLPYVIVTSDEIDLEFLEAFEADMTNPAGYGKGDIDYVSIYKSFKG